MKHIINHKPIFVVWFKPGLNQKPKNPNTRPDHLWKKLTLQRLIDISMDISPETAQDNSQVEVEIPSDNTLLVPREWDQNPTRLLRFVSSSGKSPLPTTYGRAQYSEWDHFSTKQKEKIPLLGGLVT
jgi:hypothetical protein